MVLDVEPEEESLKVPDVSIVESSAELLYGLIHQRFIITRQGLQQMVTKYEQAHFGYCPRVYCNTTKIVPCGRSDLPGVDTVKLFCPSCSAYHPEAMVLTHTVDTYTPPSSRFSSVDGAFFGTTFPHLLFQTYKELLPILTPTTSRGQPSPSATPGAEGSTDASAAANGSTEDDDEPVTDTTPLTSAAKIYIPRIYGFKVSERARSGPRMQWLRLRPRHESELDRVDSQGRWRQQPNADGAARAADPAAPAGRAQRSKSGQRDELPGRVAPQDAELEEADDAEEEVRAEEDPIARSPRSARPPHRA